MKKLYILIFLLLAASVFTFAQQPSIKLQGHVLNHNTGAPIPGQTMIIVVDSLNVPGNVYQVVTDEKGFYVVEIPYKTGSSYMAVYVSTYECNGTMVTHVGFFYPDYLNLTLDFSICDEKPRECVALFKIQPASNDSLTFYFMDGSYTSSGPNLLNYLWDFGDGTYSTEQSLLHKFNKPGFYNVCLNIIHSSDTLCSDSFCLPVNTGGTIPAPCESTFWYYNDSTSKNYIFNSSLLNGQADSWTWDFGDGTTATGQSVSHAFPYPNTNYTVCLTATGTGPDGTVCSSTTCQDIYLYTPSPCESYFWYHPDSTGGYTFEGYDNNNITSWSWDFGDGTSASGQKVSHSFNTDASVAHHVCLSTSGIGANGDTCSFISSQVIDINPPSLCENHFKIFSEGGSVYSFSGNVNSGAPADYFWDFGDGTTATGQTVTHAFGKIYTTFNVCLTTVVPNPGSTGFYECKSISCQTIYNGVDSSICKALISVIPDSSRFTYRFLNLTQSNYSYINWDFGDGSQSTESNPVHTYSSPGMYMACLTVADSLNNCNSQACQEVWVEMIQPCFQASFTAIQADSSNSITSGIMFFNTSAPGYTNQQWSFGDSSGSTDMNPVHTYVYAGVFEVCLTIWDSLGKCQSSYCMNIYVGNVINDNTVSGIVLAGNKVADQGIVWLINIDNTYNAELPIDSTGTYHFSGVPHGKYYLYAMLTPGSEEFFNYMPAYYPSSLSWQGATLINTGEPNGWYTVSLVPSMYWNQGDASITGTISWSGDGKADTNPAANVEVVLYSSTGSPIAYTFTNSDGTFEFNNLPYGEYALQAEMPGKATQLIPVSLSQSSSIVNIDFKVNESAIYILGIDTPVKSIILAGNPYPNPVLDILTIELNVPVSGTAAVEIINMEGRVIHRELTELSVGQNRICIQTSDFKKGVYQLRIKTEKQRPVQRRFVR
jgi:PKD repeat protein